MNSNTRVHRVGSLTAGLSLIVFGIMFILNLSLGLITYSTILKLWPFILIALGIELLLSNLLTENLVYDKGAVALILIMAILAACMAGADICLSYASEHFPALKESGYCISEARPLSINLYKSFITLF